jgi:hypothetical protein
MNELKKDKTVNNRGVAQDTESMASAFIKKIYRFLLSIGSKGTGNLVVGR